MSRLVGMRCYLIAIAVFAFFACTQRADGIAAAHDYANNLGYALGDCTYTDNSCGSNGTSCVLIGVTSQEMSGATVVCYDKPGEEMPACRVERSHR